LLIAAILTLTYNIIADVMSCAKICGAAALTIAAALLAGAQEPAATGKDHVSAPVPIHRIDPEYSDEARQAHHQGTVILSVVVDSAGFPTNIKVIRTLGLGLDEKAIEAVHQWRFKPGMKDGQPVSVAATIEVNFRLLLSKGWNPGQIQFHMPGGATPATIRSRGFQDPKPRAPGTVWLTFELDEKGKTKNVSVVRSSAPVLEDAAAASVRKWRFYPATLGGKPVAGSASVALTFQP